MATYYSNFMIRATLDSADDIAEQLLNQIVEKRQANRRAAENQGKNFSRPILFIAHSFGGIVVNRALIKAIGKAASGKTRYSLAEQMKDVQSSTRGAIYLGTPFNGTSISTFGALIITCLYYLGLSDRGTLLDTLSPSRELRQWRKEFQDAFIKNRYFHHFSFYEALTTWYCGFLSFKVDQESAILDSGRSTSLPTDHTGLNKFSSKEGPYKQVLKKIEELIENFKKDGKVV